jgi:hypothetical protein
VDASGNVLRAAIRRELATRYNGAGATPFAPTLGLLFAKARLQRTWALRDSARRAAERARAAAAQAAQEEEAVDIAQRCNFNTALLRFQRDRYSYGSLAHSHRAPQLRALYGRALDIAIEHACLPYPIAAE